MYRKVVWRWDFEGGVGGVEDGVSGWVWGGGGIIDGGGRV